MKPGDVLLFHRPSSLSNFIRDPMGTLFTTLIHLTTKSRYNHAAIAISETEFAEATDRGVAITRLLPEITEDEHRQIDPVRIVNPDGSTIDVIRPTFDDEEDLLEAVAWAVARTGVRYGFFNAFMCGANSVLVGLGTVIKRTDAIICSELVAEALERAGYDFGKDSALVAPGDLATAFGRDR